MSASDPCGDGSASRPAKQMPKRSAAAASSWATEETNQPALASRTSQFLRVALTVNAGPSRAQAPVCSMSSEALDLATHQALARKHDATLYVGGMGKAYSSTVAFISCPTPADAPRPYALRRCRGPRLQGAEHRCSCRERRDRRDRGPHPRDRRPPGRRHQDHPSNSPDKVDAVLASLARIKPARPALAAPSLH